MFQTILALFCFLMWVSYAWDILRGLAQVRRLSRVEEITDPFPTLAVVIAARNEAKTLRSALESVLSLNYPNIEVIAVNDRSEDETGLILDDFAEKHSNLKVVHVRRLPPGWLGKNHALQVGADQVTSKWMLFTDADVHFQPEALRKAVSLAETLDLDHLTALPQMEEHGPLLGISLAALMTVFMVFMRPWYIPSNKKYYGGLGPFNLLKTASYRKFEGHVKIKMRPDDDIMIGKLVQVEGGRSEYVFSDGEVSFSWYENVTELINGLSKNTYASVEYSLAITVISVVLHFFTFTWPVIGLLITSGLTWWFYVGSLLLLWITSIATTIAIKGTTFYGFFTPIGALLLVYIMLRTVAVTHYQGGITWRGTVYPLKELKENKI